MKSGKYFILLVMAASLLSSSCNRILHRQKKFVRKESILYPPPPDTARYQYLTSFSGSEVMGTRSKFGTFILGPEPVSAMSKPYGIFMRNGKLYVCDLGMAGIEIVDFATKKYTNFVPGSNGQLKTPLNCFLDEREYMYVADAGRHEVVLFDSVRNYIGKISDTGVFKPTDVFVSGDELFVTNPDNHRLNIYDKKTRQLKRYFAEQYGVGDDGFLYSPFNVYVTEDRVYITDFGDFKIKQFDHSGKFISALGSYGTGAGQFVRPKGIAVDRESNLFVVDAGFENTQVFNKNNQLLMFFGGPYKGPGDMWLPAKVIVDYDNLKYFEKFVDPNFKLNYLVIVSNQYGPDKINVYGSISPLNQ
jgi:6-bladed beta-propeller